MSLLESSQVAFGCQAAVGTVCDTSLGQETRELQTYSVV